MVYGEEAAPARHATAKSDSAAAAEAKRTRKIEVMATLRADYEKLKATWGGYAGYDNWFKRPINNARLNTIATYETLVPAFKQLLAQEGGDLPKFYNDAKALAGLSKEKRTAQMASLGRKTAVAIADTTATPQPQPQ